MKSIKTTVAAIAAMTLFAGTAAAQYNPPFGIGTNSPVGTLHIHSSTAIDPPVNPFDPNPREQIFDYKYETVFRFTNPNTGTTSTDGFTVTQENYHVVMQNREKGFIRLQTLGGSIYLSETGRFGVGDTALGYRFNVDGNSRLYGKTDVVGALTTSGSAAIGDTLKVGYNFRVLTNGDVQAMSLSLGGGVSATSSGNLSVGNDIAVGNIHISSSQGIYRGNNFHLSTGGNLTLQGNLAAGGNISAGGSLTVGNGFYCDAQGNAKVKELRVTLTDWPDYVFGDGYRLMPLSEVEEYISANGHLPLMPSATEVEENGADLGEMNRLLIQKVEELTLYVIDLQKQLDEIKSNK